MKQIIKKIPGKKVYLQKTKLKGFRTIRDTEIDFDPGLNILIGKNGVGKSNFLKFLQSSVIFSVDTLSQPYAFLVFSQNGTATHSIEISKDIETIVENGATAVKTNPVSFEISIGKDRRHRKPGSVRWNVGMFKTSFLKVFMNTDNINLSGIMCHFLFVNR